MAISQLCKEDFSAAIRSRGSTYFQSGRVERVQVDAEGLKCEVRGSNRQRYQVSLEWDADVWGIMARCTCPHYARGDLCKHVWAAVLEADLASWPGGVTPERVRAEHPLGLASIDVYHADETDLFMDPISSGPGSFELKWGGKPIVREPDWQARLGTLLIPEPSPEHSPFAPYRQRQSGRVAWYVLDIVRSRHEGTPIIVFAHRPRLTSGELGKPRTQAVYREDLPLFEQDADRQLMQAMLGYEALNGYGYPMSQASCRLPPVLYDVLMPRMCATGRMMLRLEPGQGFDALVSGCTWDEAEWFLEVNVAADSARDRWRFEGWLASEERRRPIGEALLLFTDGPVVFADCAARLRLTPEQVRWLDALRAGPIDVPFSSRAEFNRFWWAAQARPPIALPEGLAYETASLTPVGVLSIGSEAHPRARGERLRADASVQYGALMLPLGEPGWGVVDEASERVLMRDFPAEERLSGEIHAVGLRAAGGFAPGSFTLTPRQIPNLVAELSELGWHVGYDGALVRVPGAMSVALSSGTDWFDLEGSVDFAGVSADLPTLLKAVRRNEDYVTLPDGSRGWLTEEWRARHLAWTDLAEVSDDALRFRPGQALILDILLDAQQAERRVDPGFVQLRDRLQAVDIVEPAPAPATFKGTLRGYQEHGLGWLEFLRELNLGGCLADDMGLGKTVQILALLEVERVRGGRRPGSPSLIVVPRSLVFNWMAEAARFTPNLTLCEYGGSGRPAQRERFSEVDVVVTTYGTLRRDILELADCPFHYVVLDEAQVIKNPRAQVAKACRVLNATHRLAVTGTPVENHLGDLWSISEFLNPGLLGRSEPFTKLAREARSSEAAQEMAEALGRGLRPFILRRTKEQAAPELPPKTEQTLVCELGPRQRKLYNELRDHYRGALAERVGKVGLKRAKVHVLEALLRLRQVACHQALVDPSLANESSAKLDVLSQHLTELAGEGRKVLVFSQFTKLLALVRHRLERDGLGYEYLDGRTRDREARVRRFQESSDALAFLISLKAGGHGLNLTEAEYVFVLDPWWNPAVEAQAVDRTHRIGQTRPVFAYRLIAGNTVEEKVVEMQRHKRRLADAIVSQNQSVLGDLSMEDLDLLLS